MSFAEQMIEVDISKAFGPLFTDKCRKTYAILAYVYESTGSFSSETFTAPVHVTWSADVTQQEPQIVHSYKKK